MIPTVRPAHGADDVDAMASIDAESSTNPWSAALFETALAGTQHWSRVLCDETGAVMGFCIADLIVDELHIHHLAVRRVARRRGVATQLLRSMVAEAAQAGATSATLEVRPSNLPAQRLYAQMGFRREGVRSGYYTQPAEDADILWWRFGPPAQPE